MKVRCSKISQIMPNSKTKDPLSKTAQSYCKEWLIEQIYGYREEIINKRLSKGLIMEDEGIDLINKFLGKDFQKNTEHFENEYLTGTPDIISDCIIDIKCSYSPKTFPLFETEPNPDYVYQLQGYMELTGIKKAKLAYCLVNTPEHLIQSEVNSMVYQLGYTKEDAYEKIIHNHIYDFIDIEKRVKIFDIEYDNEVIKAIYNKVELCRNYIKQWEYLL